MTIGHGHGHNQLKGDFLCWQTLLFFSNVNGIECYTNWAKFEQFSFHRSSATLREQENFTSTMSPRRRKSLNQIQSLEQVRKFKLMNGDEHCDNEICVDIVNETLNMVECKQDIASAP